MKWLITGGCGFIGCNAAAQLVDAGADVVVVDNLERQGVVRNQEWLAKRPDAPTFLQLDIRDPDSVRQAVADTEPDVLLHLAAQTAVTTSVANPRMDFDINALGTLNILEAVRETSPRTVVLYSSTNKVYGGMEDLRVEEGATRYVLADRPHGVSEEQPLDFHSPYGCSKGVADQYVRDYARVFGLRTVVFRQSCIYGPNQYGVEDQGWVAWMTIAALTGKKITVYGTGKQVRDLLYVSDLVRVYQAAVERIDRVSGQIFNMGGGPANSVSLVEFLQQLEQKCGHPVNPGRGAARPGDQPVFIADIRKAKQLLGWEPQVGVSQGIDSLMAWVRSTFRSELVNGVAGAKLERSAVSK
jgi:CDP-paratose 2-epimerase